MARGGMPGGFDVNALMKQAQQMQTEMLKAQEGLKDEVVEASAGGGMVKVKMGGDLTLREIAIDPDAIDPEEAELLSEMVQAAVNEGLRAAQELASSKMGGITGGHGGHGPPRDVSSEGPAPLARLVAELGRLPGIGQRTAQRLAFHILRAPDDEAEGAGGGDPRGQGEGRPLRALLQPRRGAALPDLLGPRPRRSRRSAWSRSRPT